MKHFLVIDDERTFTNRGLGLTVAFPNIVQGEHVTYARNSHDGLAEIARHFVNSTMHYAPGIYLFLDHDLGEGDTIGVVVDFLCVAKVPYIKEILIHSQNPVSADYVKVLTSAGYSCKKIGLPELELKS
jgi:hypothetical protein